MKGVGDQRDTAVQGEERGEREGEEEGGRAAELGMGAVLQQAMDEATAALAGCERFMRQLADLLPQVREGGVRGHQWRQEREGDEERQARTLDTFGWGGCC